MDLYSYLLAALDGPNHVVKIARSKVYSVCSPYRAYKDLSSHYDDMVQTILLDWLGEQVDEDKDLPQVITFAQERARFQIQVYLQQFEFPVVVSRQVSRSHSNEAKGIDLEYADLGWEDRDSYGATEITIESAWKSLYYPGMSNREAWLVWYLSAGFSLPQCAVLLGKSAKTMRRELEKIKSNVA